MSRRPGFVLEVDKSTPPTLFWSGEGFSLETLPEGSRVDLRPRAHRRRSRIPTGAIRHALLHPVGDRDPLPALLRPGMKLTICFDDISLPLPADGGARHPPDGHRDSPRHGGRRRRRRRRADRGAGPAPPHDRGRAAPRPRRPGLRRLRPPRPAHPARRRGPRQPHPPRARPTRARTWRSTSGPPPRTCWSTSTSTWWPWTAATRAWPPGWPATEPAPPPQPADHAAHRSRSWTSTAPSCTRPTGAWAASSPTAGVKVFQIETTLNNDTFPSNFGFLQKREWEWSLRDRASYAAVVEGARPKAPPRLARQIFHSISPPRADLGAGRRGGGRPRAHHRRTSGPSRASTSRARPTS